MTQTEQIRAHLESGADITPIEALDRYGCLRLAARINELKAKGYRIVSKRETSRGKTYSRYRLA